MVFEGRRSDIRLSGRTVEIRSTSNPCHTHVKAQKKGHEPIFHATEEWALLRKHKNNENLQSLTRPQDRQDEFAGPALDLLVRSFGSIVGGCTRQLVGHREAIEKEKKKKC